jgi:hypothetical protein
MSRGIGILLAGVACILTGFNFWRTGWDFRENLPVPRFAGIPWAMFGVVMIVFGAQKIINKGKKPDQYLVCPVCQKVVEVRLASNNKCPKCGSDLELLEGFYERHPEFRNSNNKNESYKDN